MKFSDLLNLPPLPRTARPKKVGSARNNDIPRFAALVGINRARRNKAPKLEPVVKAIAKPEIVPAPVPKEPQYFGSSTGQPYVSVFKR